MADPTGFVNAAASAIARGAGISAEAARSALELFASPDDESRSPENSGKRIEKVDGGYRILNYYKYRERDYTNAERQRRHREKQRNVTGVTGALHNVTEPLPVTPSNTSRSRVQKQSTDKDKPPDPLKKGESVSDGFDLFWSEYPNKQKKPRAKRAWLKVPPDEREDVMHGLAAWKQSEAWRKDNGDYIPHPASFLNDRRWQDTPKVKPPKPKVVYGFQLPPAREPSEAEFKNARDIAAKEIERLRSTLRPS